MHHVYRTVKPYKRIMYIGLWKPYKYVMYGLRDSAIYCDSKLLWISGYFAK